jgi:hypothetical protein
VHHIGFVNLADSEISAPRPMPLVGWSGTSIEPLARFAGGDHVPRGMSRLRSVPVRRIRTALVLVVIVGVALLPRLGRSSTLPPDFSLYLGARPYVPLMSETNDCSSIRAANTLTGTPLDDELTKLTNWYAHFHSEGSNSWPFGASCQGASSSTLATKLTQRGAWVSNYRNGSYV